MDLYYLGLTVGYVRSQSYEMNDYVGAIGVSSPGFS